MEQKSDQFPSDNIDSLLRTHFHNEVERQGLPDEGEYHAFLRRTSVKKRRNIPEWQKQVIATAAALLLTVGSLLSHINYPSQIREAVKDPEVQTVLRSSFISGFEIYHAFFMRAPRAKE